MKPSGKRGTDIDESSENSYFIEMNDPIIEKKTIWGNKKFWTFESSTDISRGIEKFSITLYIRERRQKSSTLQEWKSYEKKEWKCEEKKQAECIGSTWEPGKYLSMIESIVSFEWKPEGKTASKEVSIPSSDLSMPSPPHIEGSIGNREWRIHIQESLSPPISSRHMSIGEIREIIAHKIEGPERSKSIHLKGMRKGEIMGECSRSWVYIIYPNRVSIVWDGMYLSHMKKSLEINLGSHSRFYIENGDFFTWHLRLVNREFSI